MPKIKLLTVNAALAALGAEEFLVKGKDYFYFAGGDAHKWQRTMVYVSKLNQLSLEEWLEEYASMKAPENTYPIYR